MSGRQARKPASETIAIRPSSRGVGSKFDWEGYMQMKSDEVIRAEESGATSSDLE